MKEMKCEAGSRMTRTRQGVRSGQLHNSSGILLAFKAGPQRGRSDEALFASGVWCSKYGVAVSIAITIEPGLARDTTTSASHDTVYGEYLQRGPIVRRNPARAGGQRHDDCAAQVEGGPDPLGDSDIGKPVDRSDLCVIDPDNAVSHQVLPAGSHQVHFNAAGYASGVYIYRIEASPVIGRGIREVAVRKPLLRK